MSLSPLESLPDELLQYIGELVEPRKRSLQAFSLASKTCHAAASEAIFRHIRLVIRYEDSREPTRTKIDLEPRITGWLSILERRAASRHVRFLVVTQKEIEPGYLGPPPAEPFDMIERDDDLFESPKRECDWDRWSDWEQRDEPHKVALRNKQCDSTWSRLSELVRRLPALADFTWDCSWPLSTRIVEALRPHVNLHLDTFWFRGKVQGEADPPELTLLRDNRLQTIKSRSIGFESGYEEDYTHEIIMALVNRLNPAVRCVSLLTDIRFGQSGAILGGILIRRNGRAPWPGLRTRNIACSPRAKLRSLEIGSELAPNFSLFETIFRECDLTELEVLKLRVHYTHRALAHLACSVQLPRLSALVFGARDQTASRYQNELGRENLAAWLLDSLPPLKAIRFTDHVDATVFESVLRRHGPTLRRLYFTPPADRDEDSFQAQQVAQLQRSCPLLEELAISVPRSRGDQVEVGIYRSLGSIPRLSRLSLMLDCEDTNLDLDAEHSDPTPIYEDFDDFDKGSLKTRGLYHARRGREPRKGHVRHAMMNAALDKRLAVAIYRTIAASKPAFATDQQLQRLELRPIRGKYIGEANDVMIHLSMWWLLESFSSTMGIPDPIATRIRSPGDRDIEVGGPLEQELDDKQIEAIFRKIWPQKAGSGSGWSEDWTGLPLQTEHRDDGTEKRMVLLH